jgi:hypothetical protein
MVLVQIPQGNLKKIILLFGAPYSLVEGGSLW